jgi:hypothetical protein
MPTGENARLEFESGQQVYPMEALTDSGDATIFDSQATLFSGVSGKAPVVVPDGLATGGAISAGVANDTVDVAALTCYLAGVKTSVSAAAAESVTRPASDVMKVISVTISSAGAVVLIAGTDGSDANFVDDRGVAGSPPYIPVGSIEIGQIRLTTSAAAVVADSEIFQILGQSLERSDFPIATPDPLNAQVGFNQALPLIHTGDLPKGVYASYADPIFIEQAFAADFVPPENSHSVSSQQYYGDVKGSKTTSLNQGSFTALMNDGVTDPLVKMKDENIWFRFAPDRYKTPRILTQGYLGMSRSYPAGADIAASCTISSTKAASGDEG